MKWPIALILSLIIHLVVFISLAWFFHYKPPISGKQTLTQQGAVSVSLQKKLIQSTVVKSSSVQKEAIVAKPKVLPEINNLPVEAIPEPPSLTEDKYPDSPLGAEDWASAGIEGIATVTNPNFSLHFQETDHEPVSSWESRGEAPYHYYASKDLDRTTNPLQEIHLTFPEEQTPLEQAAKLNIRVYINKQGLVDAVEVLEASPPGVLEDVARMQFAQAQFEVGKKNGMVVPYFKDIEILFE